MRCGVAWVALTAILAAPVPGRAAEVLLAADPDLRGPLARALGDAGLTPATEAAPEAPARAGELLAEAARAYSSMEAGRALAILGDARAELDRVGGGEEGRGTATRLALLEALALHAAGREAEVDEALRRALAVEPDVAIDPVEYPPWLRERAMALAATPLPVAALELHGAPGAEARVDGEPACVLPCAHEVRQGPHRVRVVRSGRRPFVAALTVTGPTTTLEVELEPDVAALALDARGAIAAGRPPDDARAVFDGVVWATLREDGARGRVLEGAYYPAAAPRRTATVPLVTSDAATLERACRSLVSALTAEVTAVPPGSRLRTSRRPPARPARWFESPWVWIAAGAVVAAGGIGIAVAAAAEPAGDFRPRLENPR